MPCFSGKRALRVQHPVQLDQMRVEKAERHAMGKQEKKKPPPPKMDASKLQRLEFLRVMKNDCKDIYQSRGINERELKGKFRERQEMYQLQQELQAIPSMESTTGVGRNRARRLRVKEQKQRMQLLARKEPIVTQRDLDRLKNAAKVITVEDRLDQLAKQEKETKRVEREYERTRLLFKEIDDGRRLEQELKVQQEDLWGAGEKLKILERAFLAKHEQDEDVKRVNRFILNAKCHAVRDAQIHEKNELQRMERNETVHGLERMVNENSAKNLNNDDDRDEKKREIRLQYARDIREQLSERETMRFLEAERVEHEALLLRQAHDAIKRDEEHQRFLMRERRNKFRAESASVLEMSNIFKKMLCEQEREADMRIAAYLKQKNDRERTISAERKAAKETNERSQQRIFTLSQKILDAKTQREELSNLREQERMEHEYRSKEKEALMRKKKLELDLIETRGLQLKKTKYRQSILHTLQISREEKDFNTLIDLLKKDQEKQRKLDEEREQKRRCYRIAIIQQIGDKELERRRLRELELDQAGAWRESERLRKKDIQTVIEVKLQSMRDACLPEKYIRDVEKQMRKIQNLRFKL